jgi:hypothetical protein
MKKIQIIRTSQTDRCTLGDMRCLNDGVLQFSLKSLELPWVANQSNISCIPADTYEAIPIIRPNGKWALWLQSVPFRTAILIHEGKYTRHILGCILAGVNHEDMDKDGIMDVTESARAMELLKSWVSITKSIRVEIIDQFLKQNDPKSEKRI